jgi:hypothetical protein
MAIALDLFSQPSITLSLIWSLVIRKDQSSVSVLSTEVMDLPTAYSIGSIEQGHLWEQLHYCIHNWICSVSCNFFFFCCPESLSNWHLDLLLMYLILASGFWKIIPSIILFCLVTSLTHHRLWQICYSAHLPQESSCNLCISLPLFDSFYAFAR